MPITNTAQESVIEEKNNTSEIASAQTLSIIPQNTNYFIPALVLGLSIPATLCYMLLPNSQRPSLLPPMNLSNRSLLTAALTTVGIGSGLYGFFSATKNDAQAQTDTIKKVEQEIKEYQDENATPENESTLETIAP